VTLLTMVRRGLAVCSLLAWLSLPACHTRIVGPDGGRDAPAGDAATSDVPGALALDISVTGCARADVDAGHADGGAAACTGTAPLTLTFSPVGSPALTRFRWTFGDLTPPSTDRAPTHTYLLPGIYDVGVVGEGATGSVSRQRARFVVVTADGAGTPCDIDAQCGGGLFCLCGEAAPCGDGFSHGVCTSACPTSGCGGGAACARVVVPPRAPAALPDAGSDAGDAGDTADASTSADVGAPLDAAAPGDAAGDTDAGATAASLCLAACSEDGDCSSGLVCRALPGVAGPGSWANVCVPPFFRRAGDSCRDARGLLDDGACATDLCADLGALGVCSATCAGGAACPPGTSCARFGDGRALCLTACSTSTPCESDPLLACETGAGAGALGFLASTPASATPFCAPRSCTSGADCAPSGTCKPLGVGAHCVAN
jgi:PKD repeat protein